MRDPESRTPDELTIPALNTPGIDRRDAFADEHVWVGTIRTEARTWSGWHIHPGHDTYGYVTEGVVRVEFDAHGNGIEAGPGGFVLIPAGAPHREGNPGDVPNAVVRLIAGISLFDAVLIASFGNLGFAAAALAALVATMALQKIVPGT